MDRIERLMDQYVQYEDEDFMTVTDAHAFIEVYEEDFPELYAYLVAQPEPERVEILNKLAERKVKSEFRGWRSFEVHAYEKGTFTEVLDYVIQHHVDCQIINI